MRRITLAFLAILYVGCQPWENPYDPDNPNYVYPTFVVDTAQSTMLYGDTLKVNDLKIILIGNNEANQFRWRLDSTEWSAWTGDDKAEYTISHSALDTGWHTIDVQTCYDPNSHVGDSTFKFYKVILPSIIALSDTLVHRYIHQPCTLWAKGTGSAPLEYLWLKDGTETDFTSDTVIFSAILVEQAGTYQCRLSNLWGDVFSDSMRVVVEDTTTPDFIKDSLHLSTTENTLLDINLRDSCFAGFSRELTFHALETTLADDSLYLSGRYTFSPSYTDSGEYHASAYVTDGTTNDTFAIGIMVKNVNRAPVFRDSLPKTFYQIDEGSLLSISVSASDADGDSVFFSIKETNLPHKDNCVLADSAISWQSQTNDNGAYYLKVSATDGMDTSTVSIDIGVGNVNLPPRISIEGVKDGGTFQAKENDTLRFTVKVTDPNYGDKVTLLAGRNMPFENPENGIGAYDTASGEFLFVPDFSVSSQTSEKVIGGLIFYAVDSLGLQDSIFIGIAIENTNREPSVSLVSPSNGAQGVAKNSQIKWSGTDPDGDALIYKLYVGTISDQLELVSQGKSTIYSNQNAFTNGQKYFWKVIVTDGVNNNSSIVRNFTINHLPQVSLVSPGNSEKNINAPCVFSWIGSDADAGDDNLLSYDVFLNVVGETKEKIASDSKTNSWTLQNLKFGKNYEWSVSATDKKDTSNSSTFLFSTYSPSLELLSLGFHDLDSFSPGFSSQTFNYSAVTFCDSVTLIPTTKETTAKIAINNKRVESATPHIVNIAMGTNTISVNVFTEDFDTLTYYLSIRKMLPVITEIAGGSGYTLALKDDGFLWGIGYNAFGQLGTGDKNDLKSFAKLDIGVRIRTISACNLHSIAVDVDSNLWVTGRNDVGQLGLGHKNEVLNWQKVYLPKKIISVATGRQHSLALAKDGSLYIAGENFYGELGTGNRIGAISWKLNENAPAARNIAAGGYHSLLVSTIGDLYVTGHNSDGQIGMKDTGNVQNWTKTSLSEVVSIACGSYHSLCLNNAGNLFVTGANWYGELGHGDTTTRKQWYLTFPPTTAKSISAGNYFSWVSATNGDLIFCGNNDYGQLGIGSNEHIYDWNVLPDFSNVLRITTGETHSIILDKEHRIWIAGQGSNTFVVQEL